MVKEKIKGSTKRFGARYGAPLKKKLDKIEELQKKKYKCPYCRAEKVSRKAAGIWHCKRCNSTFTGGAYYLGKGLKEDKGQEDQKSEQ